MPAEIWVGQFCIVGGEAREEGPWPGLFPPRAGLGAHLYVLVEPAVAGSDEVCQPLAAAIGRLFRQQRLSLTGGLLAALRAPISSSASGTRGACASTGWALAPPAWRCAAARPTWPRPGPALAYCRHRGQLRSLSPQGPTAVEPIGIAEEFYPTSAAAR